MREVFIYCPRSGDRVFATGEHPCFATVLWENGCRHVVGDLVRLRYDAAATGRWWRHSAKRAAEAICRIYGGIAWDERGEINLVVPRSRWGEADAAMRLIRQYPAPEEDLRNGRDAYLAEAAEMAIDEEGRIGFRPLPCEDREIDIDLPDTEWDEVAADGWMTTVRWSTAGGGIVGSVRAPWHASAVRHDGLTLVHRDELTVIG